ncbi:GIY-YIG nuclease family protein [Lysobacter solisilvae (ex Woo and Kim 2020)]|uniref:GIY-YIG nuclease family protein n=1 Tax=Agrilutibacter terrestris TaxID=2865112 RepID=A0A7H0FVC7_9GAMM|nr:GIY-YIG nuclease family protein [Lysobacter terrestris]QNP39993.1 GIY-YIG nuclease family protein [Lysobacter terrestris]
MTRWFVYLLECRDGSIYTGIATDVERRYAMHLAGKGARYTRSRPPQRLLASFEFGDRAEASRVEYAVKQLDPAQKRALCATLLWPGAIAAKRYGADESAD